MLVVLLGGLLLLVVIAISAPLWRKHVDPTPLGHLAEQNQDYVDLTIEREVLVHSLNELEVELAQGRLTPADHARLKATDERRLLQVLDRLEALQLVAPTQPPAESPRTPARSARGPAVATSVAVIVMAVGIYSFLEWRQDRTLTALRSQVGRGTPDPREMVARLEARLRENPDDLQGQLMAGRSYLALERIPEAQQAWTKALELDPRNSEAHFQLGVILLNTRKFDDPELFKTTLAHFDAALIDVPLEPAVNWYRGLALWYLKRYGEADAAWTTAFQNLAPGSDDAEFVKTALTKLRAGQAPF